MSEEESEGVLEASYEVERVLGSKMENGTLKYHVKWKGYEMSENTWEPIIHLLNAKQAIVEYEKTRRATDTQDKYTTVFEVQNYPYSVLVVEDKDLDERCQKTDPFSYKLFHSPGKGKGKVFTGITKDKNNNLCLNTIDSKSKAEVMDFNTAALLYPRATVSYITKNTYRNPDQNTRSDKSRSDTDDPDSSKSKPKYVQIV